MLTQDLEKRKKTQKTHKKNHNKPQPKNDVLSILAKVAYENRTCLGLNLLKK